MIADQIISMMNGRSIRLRQKKTLVWPWALKQWPWNVIDVMRSWWWVTVVHFIKIHPAFRRHTGNRLTDRLRRMCGKPACLMPPAPNRQQKDKNSNTTGITCRHHSCYRGCCQVWHHDEQRRAVWDTTNLELHKDRHIQTQLQTRLLSSLRPDHPRRVVCGAIWRLPIKTTDQSWSMRKQAFATFFLLWPWPNDPIRSWPVSRFDMPEL